MSCSVDLHDHYAYADPRISVYNFLRYSDRTWNAINSKLHHQNRLRAPDYIRLFGEAGMTIARAETTVPPDADERLRQLRIAERFVRAYTREELAGTILFITTIRSRRRDN